MKIYIRILYALYLIGIAIVAGYLIIFPAYKSIKILEMYYPIIKIVSIVYLLLSLIILFGGLLSKDVQAIQIETNHGSVEISKTTLENMAKSVIENVRSIKEARVRAKIIKNQVLFFINLVISKDVIIPEISDELQKQITEYIEKNCGVKVSGVGLNVTNITTYVKHKIE